MLLENYEEYARHARLYTGIHALKPKPKVKTPAMAESTTILNVDQQKPSEPAVAAVTLPPLNSTRQLPAGGISGAANSPVLVKRIPASGEKPEAMADTKKKVDARKKSLKRL